jgi:zinc transport system substrate-binding protein
MRFGERGSGSRGSASRRAVAAALAGTALLAAACGSDEPAQDGGGDPIRVVASFYPLAEAALSVGGEGVAVENLTPPGVEPHDMELAPQDLETIQSADLVVILGGGFQPAVEEAVVDAQGAVFDALEGVDTLPPPEEGHEEEEGHDEEELTADPHIWLDPARFAEMVERLANALSEVSPDDAESFSTGAEAYLAELDALDGEFRDGLATCERNLLVVNHAAFGYLAQAYGLEQVSISGVSPEAEPDPEHLAELAELVEIEGVTTIFTEELASPEVAETLAAEAGIDTAVLNPLEGLTPDQVEAGEDYISVMRTNLEALRTGLGCS